MKTIRLTFLVFLALGLAGCVTGKNGEQECFLMPALDWLFTPDANGNAPFQLLGMGLNVLIPGSGSLLALAATTYTGYRRASQWKKAFSTTAQVIESGAANGMSVADIKPHLEMEHTVAGVNTMVEKVVQAIKPEELPT